MTLKEFTLRMNPAEEEHLRQLSFEGAVPVNLEHATQLAPLIKRLLLKLQLLAATTQPKGRVTKLSE